MELIDARYRMAFEKPSRKALFVRVLFRSDELQEHRRLFAGAGSERNSWSAVRRLELRHYSPKSDAWTFLITFGKLMTSI